MMGKLPKGSVVRFRLDTTTTWGPPSDEHKTVSWYVQGPAPFVGSDCFTVNGPDVEGVDGAAVREARVDIFTRKGTKSVSSWSWGDLTGTPIDDMMPAYPEAITEGSATIESLDEFELALDWVGRVFTRATMGSHWPDVYVEGKGGLVTLVATDSVRLHKATAIFGTSGPTFHCLVNRKALQEVLTVFTPTAIGRAKSDRGTFLMLTAPGWEALIPEVEKTFPSYTSIIPKEGQKIWASIPTREILGLKPLVDAQLASYPTKKSKSAVFVSRFSFTNDGDGTVQLYDDTTAVRLDKFTGIEIDGGDAATCPISAAFLYDVASSQKAKNVGSIALGFSEISNPCEVYAGRFVAIIMPQTKGTMDLDKKQIRRTVPWRFLEADNRPKAKSKPRPVVQETVQDELDELRKVKVQLDAALVTIRGVSAERDALQGENIKLKKLAEETFDSLTTANKVIAKFEEEVAELEDRLLTADIDDGTKSGWPDPDDKLQEISDSLARAGYTGKPAKES